MATKRATVAEYLAKLPPQSRATLQTVRATIRKALPHAEELISYGIPAFRVNEGMVLYYSAWKAHYSLYPATTALALACGADFERRVVSKGTIRFELDEPVPRRLIAKIARVRHAEVLARAKKKGAARKARTSKDA